MPQNRVTAIALGLISLMTASAAGALLLPATPTAPPNPTPPLPASVNTEGAESTARGGDPVLVASGEGVLVRATNLPGDQESTEVRLDEDGRIVVPPRHVAYFRVNLSIAPVAPVQLVVYQEWTRGDGGNRYDPATLTLFEHSREVEADWDTVTCVLPEGRFNVRLAGPLQERYATDVPRPAVHYAWEGEGYLSEAGSQPHGERERLRCHP